MKAWRRRFFRSEGGNLLYFESDRGGPPLGHIELRSVLSVDASNARRGAFSLLTPHRTYELCAPSEAAALAWSDALRAMLAKEHAKPATNRPQTAATAAPATPASAATVPVIGAARDAEMLVTQLKVSSHLFVSISHISHPLLAFLLERNC